MKRTAWGIVTACAVLAWMCTVFDGSARADGFLNVRYGGAGPGTNTLVLEGERLPPSGGRKGERTTFSISPLARITVLDKEGRPLVPQPELRISPNLGTESKCVTIMIVGGYFPTGATVEISSLTTAGKHGKPSGTFR